jgi:hypothetical protein
MGDTEKNEELLKRLKIRNDCFYFFCILDLNSGPVLASHVFHHLSSRNKNFYVKKRKRKGKK